MNKTRLTLLLIIFLMFFVVVFSFVVKPSLKYSSPASGTIGDDCKIDADCSSCTESCVNNICTKNKNEFCKGRGKYYNNLKCCVDPKVCCMYYRSESDKTKGNLYPTCLPSDNIGYPCSGVATG
ncbi:MAG: hypothetical protein AABX11_07075 [Nanoarchaeota archaeon]